MFPSRRLSCQRVAHPNLLSNHAMFLQFLESLAHRLSIYAVTLPFRQSENIMRCK